MEKLLSNLHFLDTDHSKVVKTLLDGYMQDHYHQHHESLDLVCFCCLCYPREDQRLLRCSGCQLVSYCDRVCQKDDWSNHQHYCREFPVVNDKNVFYTTGSWGKHLAQLRERAARLPKWEDEFVAKLFQNPRVCHSCWKTGSESITYCKCTCVTYCSAKCANADTLHKDKCEHFSRVLCFSYSMSIFNTIYKASEELGRVDDKCSLYEMNTLTIHVVESSPIFDSRAWEGFMSVFPKLKKLNIVFVIQNDWFRPSFILNCPHFMLNSSNITYSIQRMHYHMFFSSEEYTEPDVVVIFENTPEMDTQDLASEDVIHSEISYRNMLYSPKTILVLMDTTEELVSNGVKDVNAVQPVIQLVPPHINPIKVTISTDEPDIDYDCDFFNEMQYFTCLRRK